MFPSFEPTTRLIQQPEAVFLYSRRRKCWDLLGASSDAFLRHMNGALGLDEIADRLADEFDAPRDVIANDLSALIAFLVGRGHVILSERSGLPAPITREYQDQPVKRRLLRSQIEITNRCNLRCDYCYAAPNTHRTERSSDFWIQHLQHCFETGLRVVTITGGEPLLYTPLMAVLEFAAPKFILTLNTNGLLLDDSQANLLAQLDLAAVQVSLDSLEKSVHERHRGQGSWDRAYHAIELLQRHNVPTRLSATITRENERDIEPLQRFCGERGIDFNPDVVSIQLGVPATIAPPESLSIQDVASLKSGFSVEPVVEESVQCQAVIGFAGMNPDGQLKPCDRLDAYFQSFSKLLPEEADRAWDYETSATYRMATAAHHYLTSRNQSRRPTLRCNTCDIHQWIEETNGLDA